MKQKWLIAVWVVGIAAAFFAGSWWSSRTVVIGGDPGGSGEPSQTQLANPEDVIDQDLMLALGQAKNFHHKAKVYMSDGKLAEAIEAVRAILSLKFPPGAPEADDVRNDARALLGRLLNSQKQYDEAMRVIEEGIASSSRESFFVANLYTAKGEVHYARATAMGDDPKAVMERRSAIDALDKSNKIIENLMNKPRPPKGTK